MTTVVRRFDLKRSRQLLNLTLLSYFNLRSTKKNVVSYTDKASVIALLWFNEQKNPLVLPKPKLLCHFDLRSKKTKSPPLTKTMGFV